MATIIPFLPSNIQTPRFKASFDGVPHTVEITWNVSAQRYYINIYEESTNRWVITVPLISSPPARDVANAEYDPFMNIVKITFVYPSLWPVPVGGPIYKPGTIIDYTLTDFQPITYNGNVLGLHIDELTFTYPMPIDPGPLVVLGKISRMLNMVGSVFKETVMIYRNGAFEIGP